MQNRDEFRLWLFRGAFFQGVLIFGFLTGTAFRYFENVGSPPFYISIIDTLGLCLCVYSMLLIYSSNRLITDGVFKYTRHPMYNGFLMMIPNIWYHVGEWKSIFSEYAYWVSLVSFVIGIFVAGYCQEKETIARYGDATLEYYSKTPRIFLFYPIRRLNDYLRQL